MIKDKKIIAIIPVRKNSQDIKNKNLIKIGKYSLLERTILIAQKSKFIDDVIVSTDCKKMFKISKKYKVNLKNIRPKRLATSSVSLTRILHPHPNKIQIVKNKFVKSYLNKESMIPRKLLPKVYCLNGLFYIAESNYILKKRTFFSKKTSPFFVNQNMSLNLDLPDDLIILKDKIIKNLINQNFLDK